MDHIKRIAVLLTCYNRRETTLECLRALYDQKLPRGVNFNTYLVDDGCTDGTGDAVREQFPDVNVIEGNGNLYWCSGMRMAWAEAMKRDYDYYLWLNDDTLVYEYAIRAMLETANTIRQDSGNDGIVVGSTRDPETGKQTYGGVVRMRKLFSFGFTPLEPSDSPQRCDTMNGNVVLIHRKVFKSVGNLSPDFTHGMSDNDYGLRAKEKGFSCWIAAGYVGECSRNPVSNMWFDPNLPLKERRKQLMCSKQLPPEEWLRFVRRHGGARWITAWLKLKLRLYFPRLWYSLRKVSRGEWVER